MTHVGATIPAATERLLVLLVDLLNVSNNKSRNAKSGYRDILPHGVNLPTGVIVPICK